MSAFNPAVLFLDIGGVLLSNGWGHESRIEAADKFQIDYDEMNELHTFIFNIYETGKITLDEYLNVVVFNKSRKFTKEEFIDFMFSKSLELPDTLRWIKEWKRKNPQVRVISLNNEGKEFNDYRIDKFKLHECFDAFVSSGDVGMRKPDPGIYNLALKIAHVKPKECLFIDDRQILIEAAQKLGINSKQHINFLSTKKNIIEYFKSN